MQRGSHACEKACGSLTCGSPIVRAPLVSRGSSGTLPEVACEREGKTKIVSAGPRQSVTESERVHGACKACTRAPGGLTCGLTCGAAADVSSASLAHMPPAAVAAAT